MNNRMHNCKNPYQGKAKKVLCVCSAGLLRSPTTAIVLQREHGFNTRACGIDIDHALIPLDEVLLMWADEIVCMDKWQEKQIRSFIEDAHYEIEVKPIKVLDVPDIYAYMDERLQEFILKSYEETTNDSA